MLIWTNAPRWLFAIQLLWAGIGSTAAFQLGIKEDLGLLAAGVAAGILLLVARKSKSA